MKTEEKVSIKFSRMEFFDLIELLYDVRELTRDSNPGLRRKSEKIMDIVRKSYFGITDPE